MADLANPDNPLLQESLNEGQIRFFTAKRGSATGRTGPDDTARFAENLMVLQECAILLGEKLGMNAVASVVSCEDAETVGFCFDPDSNPQEPVVAGGIVNRRYSIQEFVDSIREYINE